MPERNSRAYQTKDGIEYAPVNHIVQNYDLSELIGILQKIVSNEDKLGKAFQKYYRESASGVNDGFGKVAEKYLPQLIAIQKSGKSRATGEEAKLIKEAHRALMKVTRPLARKPVNDRNADFVSEMRGIRKSIYDASANYLTYPYFKDTADMRNYGYDAPNKTLDKAIEDARKSTEKTTDNIDEQIEKLNRAVSGAFDEVERWNKIIESAPDPKPTYVGWREKLKRIGDRIYDEMYAPQPSLWKNGYPKSQANVGKRYINGNPVSELRNRGIHTDLWKYPNFYKTHKERLEEEMADIIRAYKPSRQPYTQSQLDMWSYYQKLWGPNAKKLFNPPEYDKLLHTAIAEMADMFNYSELIDSANVIAKYFKKLNYGLLFSALNTITKDLPALNSLVKTISGYHIAYQRSAALGQNLSDVFGFSDTSDGKIGEFISSHLSSIGSIIGGLFGGAAGATVGGIAGSKIAGSMSESSGSPFATIIGLLGMAVSIIGTIWKTLKKSSPILQAISDLFNLAWTLFFMPFGNALGTILLPIMEAMVELSLLFNKVTSAYIQPIAQAIANVITKVLTLILTKWEILAPFIEGIATLVGNIMAWLINNSTPILDLMLAAMNYVSKWFIEHGENFLENIQKLVDSFVNFKDVIDFGKLFENIASIATTIVSALANVNLEQMVNDIRGIVTFLNNLISNPIETAGGTVGTWLWDNSSAKKAWENIKGVLGLATGGVVTSATLAVIGEAGPEAVIPLDKMGAMGATIVNINGDVYGVSDLENRIERVIQRTANKSSYR